jgi:hypothetical protein
MSATFTFELKSSVPSSEIRSDLFNIWGARFEQEIDVTEYPYRKSTLCHIGYYTESDLTQKARIKKIIAYLFKISTDGLIYYFTWGEYPEESEEIASEVDVDDIFEHYHPWLMKGRFSKYLRIRVKAL